MGFLAVCSGSFVTHLSFLFFFSIGFIPVFYYIFPFFPFLFIFYFFFFSSLYPTLKKVHETYSPILKNAHFLKNGHMFQAIFKFFLNVHRKYYFPKL